MEHTTKQRLRDAWPAVRVAISVGMLAVLVTHVHVRSLLPGWRSSTVGWLAAAIAVTVGGIVLSAVRWQRVLFALDMPAPLPVTAPLPSPVTHPARSRPPANVGTPR